MGLIPGFGASGSLGFRFRAIWGLGFLLLCNSQIRQEQVSGLGECIYGSLQTFACVPLVITVVAKTLVSKEPGVGLASSEEPDESRNRTILPPQV